MVLFFLLSPPEIKKGLMNYIAVISDYRGTDLHIGFDDFSKLANFLHENINLFKNLKMAQIIDTPLIAFPIYFGEQYPEFKTRPFSTIEAAKDWILQ